MAMIGALLGASLSYMQNRDANDRQKDAMNLEQERFNLQKGFAERLQELNKILMEKVMAADKSGLWDSEAAAKRFETDTMRRQKGELENLGAGLSNAGFQGTDSEVKYQFGKAVARNQKELQTGMETARKGSLMDMIAAYNSTNPQTLQGAGNLLGQSNLPQMMMQDGLNKQVNMGGMFASMLPYLQARKNKNQIPSTVNTFGMNPLGETSNWDGSVGVNQFP